MLRSALTEIPNQPELLTLYAQALSELEDYPGAAWAAHAALTALPNYEAAMRVYTHVLHRQGRSAEALQMAWTTAATHPNSAAAHHLYAEMLTAAGHFQHALAAVDRAIQINSASANSWVLRGEICRSMRNPKAAAQNFHEALRLDPENAMATLNLALDKMRWTTMPAALNGLVRAQQLNPELGAFVHRKIATMLGRVSWGGFFLVGPLAAMLTLAALFHQESWSQDVPRAVAGVTIVVLAAVIGWIFWSVPGPVLRAMLRAYRMLVGRLALMIIAVIAGTVMIVVGTTPLTSIFGPLLCVGIVVVRRLGFLNVR